MKSGITIEHMQRKFSVIIEADETGGYVGYIAGLPGCITQGETVEELMEHMREALELYLSTETDAEPTTVVGIREIVL